MIKLLLKVIGAAWIVQLLTGANDVVPYYEDGDELPTVATATITGKRLVQITAARTSGPGLAATSEGSLYQVGHPNATGAQGAGKPCLGVACWDAPVGGMVTVMRGKALPVFASAAVTHGQEVQVAADGSVIPLAAGIAVGYALNDAAINTDAEIMLYQ